MNGRIAVLLPVCNAEKFLRGCLLPPSEAILLLFEKLNHRTKGGNA